MAASGSAETDRNCLGNSFIAESETDTWITAQGSMSNANICGRFRCSERVEKHLPTTYASNSWQLEQSHKFPRYDKTRFMCNDVSQYTTKVSDCRNSENMIYMQQNILNHPKNYSLDTLGTRQVLCLGPSVLTLCMHGTFMKMVQGKDLRA